MSDRKSVLIIGASKGIGRAIAIEFAKQGYDIAMTYQSDKSGAESVAQEISQYKTECLIQKLSVQDESQVEEVISKVNNYYGHIDVLVNNAGIFEDSLVKNMGKNNWLNVIDTNLNGVFYCIKHIIRIMENQQFGRILNIGSVVANAGSVGAANYAASKAGVVGLTKSIAREVAKKGITVNTISLGYMNEGMGKRIPDKIKEKVIAQIPMGKLGDAINAAKMIVHLASDEAEYITGQVIGINGGFYM